MVKVARVPKRCFCRAIHLWCGALFGDWMLSKGYGLTTTCMPSTWLVPTAQFHGCERWSQYECKWMFRSNWLRQADPVCWQRFGMPIPSPWLFVRQYLGHPHTRLGCASCGILQAPAIPQGLVGVCLVATETRCIDCSIDNHGIEALLGKVRGLRCRLDRIGFLARGLGCWRHAA